MPEFIGEGGGLTFTVSMTDVAEITKRLESVSPRRANSLLLRAFRQSAALVERKVKENITGTLLHRRSGHLAQSIETQITQNQQEITAKIGSGVRSGIRMSYANIHETGGVITPKKSQFLTIPFPYAQTRAGVGNITARELFDRFKGMVFIAHGIIFLKRGKSDASIVPMFKLVRSVSIKASHYLSKSLEQMSGRIIMAMRGSIERSLKNEQSK